MITVDGNVAVVKGSAKEISTEFTHILVNFINCLERDFNLSREESQKVISECVKVAYMNDEERAKFLSELENM